MIPLIDADILLYEIGFGSETGWKHLHPESSDPPPFQYVQEMVDGRIQEICNKIEEYFGVCEKPRLFLTGKNNFREELAKKKKYKGNRTKPKPFHYNNIKAYLQVAYECVVTEGYEADDALCISQTDKTIICSRDKDLFMGDGWLFSWELGKQPQRGPLLVADIGAIRLSDDNKKLRGEGVKFFYSQVLMGDAVDNILGLPGFGPKKTFNILSSLNTELEIYYVVRNLYEEVYGITAEEELTEQCRLLWMVREKVEDRLLMWSPPDVAYEDWYDITTRQIERVEIRD